VTLILIGIVIFGGIHLFSMLAPAARDRISRRLGEGPWKGLYSLVSLVGLGLIIWGFSRARSGPEAAEVLYFPAEWTRHAAMLLVLLAFIAIGAFHGKGHIKLWLQQPMSVGIALWAFAHLLANGQKADVVMFGFFLALALLDIVLSTMRGKIPHYQPQLRSDLIAVVVGIVLFLIFLFGFHPYILNVPVVA
jgi:uncharacterized membrane protein